MFTAIATVLIIVVVFVGGLFLARRLLRLALKLAFVGAIIFALFVGGLFGWWRGWFAGSSQPEPPHQTNRRANSNARPTR